MNKTEKRQLNIRNKLIAAIAMLLVSSIMMVSTTYAWFTLSTAPEVQGITTTVGANGSLEIALSPLSGDYNEIDSNVGDSNLEWFEKNVTWGNLLDMGQDVYELDAITLTPAQLKLNNGVVDATNSPLARPAYGADGRVSELKADTQIGGKVAETDDAGEDTLSAGFQVGGGYGVRAIGTASGLTENERLFNSGKSALRTGTTQAASVASASLNANGDALANLMVAHAMAEKDGATDSGDYVEYIPALQDLVAALNNSVTQIDNAMKGALLAAAATQVTGDELTTAQSAINGADMETFDISTAGVTDSTITANFSTIQTARNSIADDVEAATSALNNIASNTSVSWTEVYSVVQYLMNTNGVTINGQSVSYVSQNYTSMISDLISGVELKLGAGSGVYYKIHQIASKIAAGTDVTIDASGIVSGMGEVTVGCTIETTFEGTSYLPAMTAVLSTMNAATESGDGATTATKLDVYYGYILDFVFRTNAAGSYLNLQTEGVNRVYTDGGSETTQGSGSTITFTIPEGVNANIVKGLVEGIRITFFDTASGEVYGIAKVTSVATEEATDEAGNPVTNMVGTLELYGYETDATGLVTVSDAKADDSTTTDKNEKVVLCALDQNVAKRVSAMVSLDGSDITNADIMAEGNVTGILNLQFSSSAELVPMENSELMAGN